MALTQIQIIQSLGEAMNWFEKEIQWGVPPTELRHLVGRIGELYAALITNGQMANDVNQHGYDVVSATGERVSVKTTAKIGSAGHISFNPNTLSKVDRVIILRVNTEEMQIETLLDLSTQEATSLMSESNIQGKSTIALSKLVNLKQTKSDIPVVRSAVHSPYRIEELENGTIQVLEGSDKISPAKPILRKIAEKLGISLFNSSGNPYNTRQLGSLVIKGLQEKNKR